MRIAKPLPVLVAALALLTAPAASVAHGQEVSAPRARPLPNVTSDFIRNNARITFEWPQPVGFTADAKGRSLTINFARPAAPDFGETLSAMYPFITSAQRKDGGRTIVFTLNKPYKIRTFASDNISGVELLNVDISKRRIVVKNEQSQALLSPAAGGDTAGSAAAATTPPEATAPASAGAAPVGDSGSVPAAPFPENRMEPEEAQPTKDKDTLKVNVSASEDAVTLRLPFNERMAVAAYVRNSSLWVVFNKPVKLNLGDFADLPPKTVVGKAEIVAGRKTVLRVPITDDTIKPYVTRDEKGFEWAILLTGSPRPAANPLKVNINTDPPAPPHVFINSLEMGEPYSFIDPVVGDELVVTPLYKTGEAIAFQRDFVEFTLLETAQGVVMAKKADNASVLSLRNGLRISLPQGATLTPGLPDVEKSKTPQILKNTATLFPYEDWKAEENPSRRRQINGLLQQIVNAKDGHDANDHRLRLAQIYLSEGLAAEAIGLLDGINRTNPTFYKSSRLAAMRGAANFLMTRHRDALRDFSTAELNNNREMEYWRGMLADLNGRTGQYNYMEMNEDYISKYPPSFRQKLAIVAADRAVDNKEYNIALKIFETLKLPRDRNAPAPEKAEEETKHDKATEAASKENEAGEAHADGKDEIIAPITPYVNFLLAKIAVETGQLEEGLTSWNKLAEDHRQPFVQSRAEFSRVLWQMHHNALNKTQAIDRLERLRIVWHGDALELKVIALLGELYFEQKDYINAMRIWDSGVNSFPDAPEALAMTAKLEETFILMFGEGSGELLSNMDALALYYQYKSYAPTGSVGREMITRLADRLVAVDLLDQATRLLEHQMRYESEKVQRSQIGAKVATIHLLNHQPKRALNALQDSVYGENPAQLRQLRNRLAAQAYFEVGDIDKAYLVLGQDDSADADTIRLNIYWARKDWKQVIPLVENLLKRRQDVNAPITLAESEYVLKLGLAYIFEQNTSQLDYLHDYFTPLMADNPNKPIFEFITTRDIAPTPYNFDEILKKLSDTRSFINSYQARIAQSGVSAVVPPVPGAK